MKVVEKDTIPKKIRMTESQAKTSCVRGTILKMFYGDSFKGYCFAVSEGDGTNILVAFRESVIVANEAYTFERVDVGFTLEISQE